MLINDSNQVYLLEVLVTVDVLLVMRVLQFIGFDILPEGLDDTGASLCVYSQQASQTRIQFKLRRLHTEHKAQINNAFHSLFSVFHLHFRVLTHAYN